ncbi:hypothetical protein SORBI_3004G347700 [Sorghum bicolor]|uniref:F-box domain-containing protein n=1 Tax=Sorghum bicolor TaxID=4558 RepID=A0A194YT72_SORBI|nr:hypothetical protein SORBI_3004G347700 [Sorghum bicolor]
MDSELLEEMFLRVASPAPADLAHASAACVSFRRLIADHSFLHSTHPPLLLWLPTYPCRSEAPHPFLCCCRVFLPSHRQIGQG